MQILLQPYIYKSLETSSIRIIRLHPAQSLEAALHCELIHRKLADLESYEAISYVWGDAIFSETLHISNDSINDSIVKITPSLSTALRHFRQKDRERILWADAICIDQSNDAEKSIQVAMMSEIYKRADRVLAFIGPAIESLPWTTFTYFASRASEFGITGREYDMTGLPGPMLYNVPPFNASTYATDATTAAFEKIVQLGIEIVEFLQEYH